MKGISRIESAKCVGWLVRVYQDGKTYAKLFSDHKHGSKNKALREAKKHHAMLAAQHPQRPRAGIDAPAFQKRLLANNTTGVTGVYRSRARSGDNARTYAFFGVSFKLNGKHQTKKVYIHHFDSEALALAHAVRLRKKFERQMTQEFVPAKR